MSENMSVSDALSAIEGLRRGRREERERLVKIIQAEKSICHYDSGDTRGDYQCEIAYERACDDILAALEEPKL